MDMSGNNKAPSLFNKRKYSKKNDVNFEQQK